MGDRNPTQTSLTVKGKTACLPCTGLWGSLGNQRQSSRACPRGPDRNVALPSGDICEIRLPHLLSGVGLFLHCSLASSTQLRWWPTIWLHIHVALTPKEREALISSSETSQKDSDGSVCAGRRDARIGLAEAVHTHPYPLPSS